MESMMPSVSNTNSASLLKKVHFSKKWLKEYVTDSGVLLLKEARKGNVNRIVDLLCKGAPFVTDSTGVSPLHFAAFNNSSEVTELLLNGGMMRDTKNKVDRTALHIAAQMGHANVVKILLTYGADPDVVDLMNMTALHWSVEGGCIDCVRLLLQYGARSSVIDNFGRTPLDIATNNKSEHITFLLENRSKLFKNPIRPKIVISKEGLLKGDGAEDGVSSDVENLLKQSLNRLKEYEKKYSATKPLDDRPTSSTRVPSFVNEKETIEMLKEHGIQMLEPDKVTTVHSAVESGQKIVLTEAGKLALNSTSKKEPSKVSLVPKKNAPVRPNNVPVIIKNGKKMIKINPGRLISFNLEKDKSFFKNVNPSGSIRVFEGKYYTEEEEEILRIKLRTAIGKIRNEAKLLDIFSKRKFRLANLYQQQLLSLTHLDDKNKPK